MIRKTIVITLGISAAVFSAHGAIAAQDPAFGYDAFHQFGYERQVAAAVDTSHLYKSTAVPLPGFEVDYVYGSEARALARSSATQTVMDVRDALGSQPGA